eukprot:6457972-Amphidinium_carterae.1
MNRFEVSAPFVQFKCWKDSDELQLAAFKESHAAYAREVIYRLWLDPPADYAAPFWVCEPGLSKEAFAKAMTDFYAQRLHMQSLGDDSVWFPIISPQHGDRCPCGAGLLDDEGHAEHSFPPTWLVHSYQAAIGRDGTISRPKRQGHCQGECLFLSRQLVCQPCEVLLPSGASEERNVPRLVPNTDAVWTVFLTPDRDEGVSYLDRVRIPAALSRLLMGYTNARFWSDAGATLLALFAAMGEDPDTRGMTFWTDSEGHADRAHHVSLRSVRQVAQQLFRISMPMAQWECQLADEALAQHAITELIPKTISSCNCYVM